MAGIMFDHIDSLEKSRTNWKIKVRLTRFWPTFSPETNTIKGYNMILLDDDNSHVHAYVYPDNWKAIGKDVVEGGVYVIENFQVRDTIGRLKPVSTKICIRLFSSTTIESVANDNMIPQNKFEFMDLGDLFAEANRFTDNETPEFAVDLIGRIKDFQKVKPIHTRYGTRKIVRFKIAEGSIAHKVVVWGDFAQVVSDSYTDNLEKPVIGILTSTKLSIFMNTVQIATLPSSKVYFNLDHEAVAEFRQRLLDEGYNPSDNSVDIINIESDDVPEINLVTFKDLIDNSHAYFAKKFVLTKFTINKIDEEVNWWYFSCNVCHDEVERVDKKFRCSKCSRNFPYSEKRFRILILADDKTTATNVILMDRVVKRLVGTTVTNLFAEIKKNGDVGGFPPLLKQMVGKEITVKIALTEANIEGESSMFDAIDLCDPYVQYDGLSELSPIPKATPISETEVMQGIELFQTPDSVKPAVLKKIKLEEI